jgi:diguanylate cyclase
MPKRGEGGAPTRPPAGGRRNRLNAWPLEFIFLRSEAVTVGTLFKRALQFGTMFGIVVLGALIWRQSAGNSFVEACVFGLIALGVVGVGVSEIKDRAAASLSTIVGEGRPYEKPSRAEQRFAADLATIARLLQAYLTANSSYSDSLVRANKDLPLLEKPEQIRAVVLSLIEENRKIQTKVDDLSRNLDESVAKIEKLGANLAEANDKALRDPLTALGNRRFFDQKLDSALREARAESGELCLAMCDIDRFKAINDKFGHPVGDMVLRAFSEIVSSAIGGQDTAARVGGEEFAIIFPGAQAPDAATVAGQIRKRLEAKKWLLGSSGAPLGAVTASFGVVQLRAEERAAQLFKRADEALYRAKSTGRNRVVVG